MVFEYATCGCDICLVLVIFFNLYFLFRVCILMFSSRSRRRIACAVKHWTSAADDALTTTTRRKKKVKYNMLFFFCSLCALCLYSVTGANMDDDTSISYTTVARSSGSQ